MFCTRKSTNVSIYYRKRKKLVLLRSTNVDAMWLFGYWIDFELNDSINILSQLTVTGIRCCRLFRYWRSWGGYCVDAMSEIEWFNQYIVAINGDGDSVLLTVSILAVRRILCWRDERWTNGYYCVITMSGEVWFVIIFDVMNGWKVTDFLRTL